MLTLGIETFAHVCYSKVMKLNRTVTRKITSAAATAEGPVELSPSESLSFVWDLTAEVFSLTKEHDVKSRLQRNAVNITRRRR